ncbi:T6SS phospholipase effector Tle1-like catalytic domain-containing protein [Sulfurirhabdus autotrophica]|uniref:Putative alpha/beta hydrolase family protein DUF2235 n=1 Tax=Sulfurirhabdus autotrophica TaxID=1706046 RepID=A0A4R3XW36_9PROT|nr:DUF2235 domain-containing protein [Sulfurirhabdus autotrophica]TCV81100.1 putative alpha/beta hydrolase family protein DUF2235 [Sulfurirhabdus autotrophica]
MATISPKPFPADGYRKLSAKETIERAKALNCMLPVDNKPTCSGQVHVGIFFDGTGNNKKADYEDLPPKQRKHSNVVKLFHAYPNAPKQGHISYYIPGVGTPFPEIGEKSAASLGSPAAEGGAGRILWGLMQLLNAPYRYVTGYPLFFEADFPRLSNSYGYDFTRRKQLNDWQTELKLKLADKKPLVEQINLSVFGFSRGAAEARVFCNWLMEVCKEEGGGWSFAGIPIRIAFLGIFDTVASVGTANLWGGGLVVGHQSWADNALQIHPAIEKCAHFVAGHEVRATFPLDSVRVKNIYPGNAKEVMYPGSHSDLGGGYAPNALGLIPKPNDSLSIIPGMAMYNEAQKAGVPLIAWKKLLDIYQRDLTASEQTIKAFNAYLKDANTGAGPVEELHERHMALYLSYRFKYRHALKERIFYRRANSKDRGYLETTQKTIYERLKSLGLGDPNAPDFDPRQKAEIAEKLSKAGKQTLASDDIKTQQLYKVAKSININKLTPAIEYLCENYIHDSMAGFIGMKEIPYFGGVVNEYRANGMGIMKFRSVFKGDD